MNQKEIDEEVERIYENTSSTRNLIYKFRESKSDFNWYDIYEKGKSERSG